MWTINFLPLKMSPTSGWLGLIRPSIAESTNGARDSTSQTRLYFIMFHSSKEESQGFEEHKGDQMITKSFKFLDLAKNIYGPSTFSICFYPKQLLNANNYKLLIIICNISVTKAERRPVQMLIVSDDAVSGSSTSGRDQQFVGNCSYFLFMLLDSLC